MNTDTIPHIQGSATSLAAVEAIRDFAPTGKEIVLAAIKAAGLNGLTDAEGIEITGLKESTYRPRRISLVGDESKGIPAKIIDYGLRRKTDSGRDAVAWVAIGVKA